MCRINIKKKFYHHCLIVETKQIDRWILKLDQIHLMMCMLSFCKHKHLLILKDNQIRKVQVLRNHQEYNHLVIYMTKLYVYVPLHLLVLYVINLKWAIKNHAKWIKCWKPQTYFIRLWINKDQSVKLTQTYPQFMEFNNQKWIHIKNCLSDKKWAENLFGIKQMVTEKI